MKNKILIMLTIFFTYVFLISACAIDSDSWIPTYIMLGSMVWLMLFGVANHKKGE